MGDEKKASIEDLVVALNFCIQERVEIINLSIGTTRLSDYQKIYPMIQRVIANNIVVVAAQSNQNRITVPACLPNVIGVISSTQKLECTKRVEKNRWGINLIVPLEQYIDDGIERPERVEGNSYAVPAIISELCRFKKKVSDLPIDKICNLFLEQFQILGTTSIDEEIRKKSKLSMIVPYIYFGNKALCEESIILEMMNTFQARYGIETICIVNEEKEDVRFIQFDKRRIKDDINNNFYSDVDLIFVEFFEEINDSIKKEFDIILTLEDNGYALIGENENGKIACHVDKISQVCDKIVALLST